MDNKNSQGDDYLSMNKYEGHSPSNTFKGFSTFEAEGQHYFIMYDKAGKAFMRSEGYSSDKGRDNGIQSVIKNRTQKDRWSIKESKNRFYILLKAGNNQEIARSDSYKSKVAAESAMNNWLGGSAAAGSGPKDSGTSSGAKSGIAAAGIAGVTGKVLSVNRKVISEKRNVLPGQGKVIKENRKVIGEKRNVIGEKRNVIGTKRNVTGETRNLLTTNRAKAKEDDYLKCDAYKGHKMTDPANRIARFTGPDKQLYFVLYDDKGNIRLRSEGFENEAKLQDELKHVIMHKENAKQYSTVRKGKYYFNVLKDKTGREIGRSCVSDKPMATVAYVATTITAANIARKGVVEAAAVAPVVAGADGCIKLWWIPLLFLLPLLLLWKGCPVAVPPPPAIVAKVIPPAPVLATPKAVCKCADLTHPIFKIPPGPAPKTTTVLGRAPEYGDSHALSPSQFYDKLNNKFKGSQMERTFLDGIFKQMGYEKGWADAKPSMFTAVTVPRGVEGNLGTKVTHKTVYRKLDPTNARDLKGFRIEAKNACHLHFMKTCGNHFYFGDCE